MTGCTWGVGDVLDCVHALVIEPSRMSEDATVQVSVRLSAELKRRWRCWLVARGETEAGWLRKAIAAALEVAGDAD